MISDIEFTINENIPTEAMVIKHKNYISIIEIAEISIKKWFFFKKSTSVTYSWHWSDSEIKGIHISIPI